MRAGRAIRAGATAVFALTFVAAATEAAARPDEPAEAPAFPTPAREPLPDPKPLPPPPWRRHVDLGAGAAFIGRYGDSPASSGPTATLAPTVGLHISARVSIVRALQVEAAYAGALHRLEAPPGSLGPDVDPAAAIETSRVRSYGFSARVLPTLELRPRTRLWGIAGIAYGRLEYDRMTVREAAGSFVVRERADTLIELPLGVGGAIDVARWLSIDLSVVLAPVLHQRGSATNEAQAIDASGAKQSLAGLPQIDASLVAALGASLLL